MDNRLVIAVILVLTLALIVSVCWGESFIILPEEMRIPIINVLQKHHWKLGKQHLMHFEFMNFKKLRWHGGDHLGEPIEMTYHVNSPTKLVIHTPVLSDYDSSRQYFELELVSVHPTVVKLQERIGLHYREPKFIRPTIGSVQ